MRHEENSTHQKLIQIVIYSGQHPVGAALAANGYSPNQFAWRPIASGNHLIPFRTQK